ncbi:hypothetical protein MJO28_013124 [Puccinia striiformis f. sp. tritici]|uniref:Uncharacterized protein n=1 Tax=Puccinia striiformis f. sp. tritici TaxID=168172 RepID=A0ACC0DXP9_9BASI|nr:hypothetical protein MJO28_013124 [Puccinia striiformis f. sp. tritici]
MAQAKKRKVPPPCTSSPTDQTAESQAAGSNIEVTKSQSDIVLATPSISQATTTTELVKQPSNIKTDSNQLCRKRKAMSDIWDHFTKKGTGTYFHSHMIPSSLR